MIDRPFHFAMLSHVGRVRKGNEDTCAASPEHGVFVVCDGMGGAAAGEVASARAAETFLDTLINTTAPTPESRLEAAIHAANQAVYQQARSEPSLKGMGTTLVALLVEDESMTLAHVGDSRCYRLRAGTLTQLTADHSLVEEQVRQGEITPAQAAVHPMRNIITRVIGTQPAVQPDIAYLDSQTGDLYLLASDGLTRDLNDIDLATVLSAEPDLPILCQALIDKANNAGGGDNITVLLLHIP